MPEMMNAVTLTAFGDPDVLRYTQVPRPEPAKGEVLVRVHATVINPFDREIRSGVWGDLGYTLPIILGTEMAGVVAALGDTVGEVEVGQQVWGVAYQNLSGALAEYALTREEALGPKPASLDFPAAATVPMAASTARQVVLDDAELRAGQTLLVHGAGGSVGSFAVQLAKRLGAQVIATAGPHDQEWVRSLGADVVLDHSQDRFEDVVGDGVDAVYDPISGDVRRRSIRVLKPGGVMVSSQAPADDEDRKLADQRGVALRFVMVQTTAAQLRYFARLVDAGQLRTRVGATFPLEQAADAHRLADSRNHLGGKIVVTIPEASKTNA